jgi:hypothetical protein
MADQYLIQGKNAVMYKKFDGIFYRMACAKNFSFKFINENILKTDINAGSFRRRRVRISDFTASFSGVLRSNNGVDYVSGFHFLEEGVRRVEEDYRIIFTDNGANIKKIEFNAIIKEVGIDVQMGPYTEYGVELDGNGSLTITEGAGPGAAVYSILSDWWPTVAGQNYVAIGAIASGKNAYMLTAADVTLEIDRSGFQHDEVTGTPIGRQGKFNTTLVRAEFENNFEANETIFILFKRPL